jgi:aspartate aminotransferase-like enzyme
MSETILWIPGPTQVRAELLAECARPMIGHRSKAMTALTERLDPGLKLAFGLAPGSRAHVAVHSTSATGLMEAALRGAGPRILALVNGAFSKRFAEIAALVGKQVTRLEAPMGRAVPLEQVVRALEDQGPFDALTVVSNETSTGVRQPLPQLAAALAGFPDVLLLVDLVSYLAGAPVDFDANRIDFGFAGVQKALALPPGISVLCASERYLENAKRQPLRGFYLDPLKIIEGHEQRATPATPCISLYYALARQLEDIGKTGAPGWAARFEEHARMQRRTETWAGSNDLELLPPPELRSPTISAIRSGALDVAAFLAAMQQRGHELGDGYGELKGQTFRIGHMGDHTESELAAMLAIADDVIAGLRAAQPAR